MDVVRSIVAAVVRLAELMSDAELESLQGGLASSSAFFRALGQRKRAVLGHASALSRGKAFGEVESETARQQLVAFFCYFAGELFNPSRHAVGVAGNLSFASHLTAATVATGDGGGAVNVSVVLLVFSQHETGVLLLSLPPPPSLSLSLSLSLPGSCENLSNSLSL